jgi:hypothetical protein
MVGDVLYYAVDNGDGRPHRIVVVDIGIDFVRASLGQYPDQAGGHISTFSNSSRVGLFKTALEALIRMEEVRMCGDWG